MIKYLAKFLPPSFISESARNVTGIIFTSFDLQQVKPITIQNKISLFILMEYNHLLFQIKNAF